MKKSLFQRLDPRVRLLWMFLTSAVAIYHNSLVILGLIILSVLPVWIMANNLRLLVKTTRSVIPFLLFIIVTRLLSIWIYKGFILDADTLTLVIGQIMKVYVMVTSAVLLFQTTSYEEVALSLRSFKRKKHGRWNIFMERVAFVFGTAFQFIPLLTNELSTMVEVRRARGDGITEGKSLEKAKKMVLMGFPLINRAFDIIKNLLLSLINYNYDSSRPRTQYRSLQFFAIDIAALGVLLSYASILFVVPQ